RRRVGPGRRELAEDHGLDAAHPGRAVELQLDAAPGEQRSSTVQPRVPSEKAVEEALGALARQLSALDLDLDRVNLLPESQSERMGDRDVAARCALALELC